MAKLWPGLSKLPPPPPPLGSSVEGARVVDTSRKTQVAPTPQSLSLVQGPPDPKKQDEKNCVKTPFFLWVWVPKQHR